jgi:hypothetical protein
MASVYTWQKPLFVVNSLAEAKARWAEVRELLPPPPFVMDGQWVVRLDAEGPRTWPDKAETFEFFSPNTAYVVTVELLKDAEGRQERQRERLLGIDGRLCWERERRAGPAWVLDRGRVVDVWLERAMAPLSLELVEPDGGTVLRRDERKLLYPAVGACAEAGLLLFVEEQAATAWNQSGDVVWRWAGQDVRAVVRSLRAPFGDDPLGRGIWLTTMVDGKGVGILLLDPRTGRPTRMLVPHRGALEITALSPRGQMAACSVDGGVALIDWTSGEALFAHTRADRVGGQVVMLSSDHAISASDKPARLAAPLGSGDTVFDRAGRVVWRNYLHTFGSRRLTLSSDGLRLGAVFRELGYRGQGPVVSSIVGYALPADGEVAQGP